MKLLKSIWSECRIGLVRYAGDRGTGEDPSEMGKPVDATTADDWKPDIQRDEVILAPNVSSRVVATVTYRCSLPFMVSGSANDEAMNGNATGGNGTYKEIEIFAGPLKGTHALWKPE